MKIKTKELKKRKIILELKELFNKLDLDNVDYLSKSSEFFEGKIPYEKLAEYILTKELKGGK